ncbi:unnamed protein product [Aphanomyces euteiches]
MLQLHWGRASDLDLPRIVLAEEAFHVQIGAPRRDAPLRIWLQAKQTKRQWECVLKSGGLRAHSASTTKDVVLPEGSILYALKRALRAHGEDQAPKPKDCDVTLSTSPDGSLELALSVVVFDVLKAAYEFHLDQLAVPELVVLAAKVVDLEDEVQELKRIIASIQEQLSAKKRKIRDKRLSMAAAPPSP